MFEKLIKAIVDLKENKTYQINGETYSDNPLVRVAPHVDRPDRIEVGSLNSIVKLIRNELDLFTNYPIFVRVVSPTSVMVCTALDDHMRRDFLYIATSDVPPFREGFRVYESAMIELRSKFVPVDDVDYLLDLLSRISIENGVTTTDNGLSQSVEARSGIALKKMETIKPRVTLTPYRTFLEVEQPKSEFLLRLSDCGEVGLFEADGRMWTLTAKKNIADYLEKELNSEIANKLVVVMQ